MVSGLLPVATPPLASIPLQNYWPSLELIYNQSWCCQGSFRPVVFGLQPSHWVPKLKIRSLNILRRCPQCNYRSMFFWTSNHHTAACNEHPTRNHPWILGSTCSKAEAAPFQTIESPYIAPPEHHVPCWTLHCPTLTDSMMQELHRYLLTAPSGNMPPSPHLQVAINRLPNNLLDTSAGELSSEETTSRLWHVCLFKPIICDAVQEVDENYTWPVTLEEERTLYSQTPVIRKIKKVLKTDLSYLTTNKCK